MDNNNTLMFQIGIKEVKETIDSIQEKFDKFNEKYGEGGGITVKLNLQGATREAEALIKALKMIGDPDALKPYEQEIANLKSKIDQLEKAAKKAGESSNTSAKEHEASVDSLMTKYKKLAVMIENRQANLSKLLAGTDSNYFASQIREAIEKYNGVMRGIKLGGKLDLFDESHIKTLQANFALLEKMYANVNREAANFNKNQDKVFQKASTTADNLGKHIDQLNAKKINFKGMDFSEFDAAISKIRAIKTELERFASTGSSTWGNSAKEIVRNMGLAEANEQARAALRMLNNEKRQGVSATIQLTSEEQRLANAIKNSTDSMRGQSQVLADLKTMAMQYISVWGAQNFVNNIIEIGGQLEKQRLSIAAILQDASHGADLFDKIKRLAVQSPFGVVELDQFTKQLSAYGFKYNELYDMTKRLADISAGAGTEVSRLALALGHVRAEGALSGYTLRQFAMNNIPMVSELAKKLSEVEGHLVTTADIRKRVSNKEIGYQDVEDVIKKLTNEGGMFFRMQEVISESVQAKFKNLRDSFDIMYGEIAKSTIGDFLKEVATTLTKMSRSWKSFIPIIESVGIAFAAYRASLLLTNMSMGKNTAAMQKSILAAKQKRAADLESMATIRSLSVWEQKLVANKNSLTAADLRAAMATQKLTKDEALRLVALRKLTIEEAAAAVNMGLFSEAEVMAARSSSLLMTRIRMLATTLKTSLLSLSSMVFNKWNAFFAMMSIGMSLYQNQQTYNEDRKARIEDLWQRSREGQRNLGEMKATYRVGMSAELDKDGLKQAIADLKDKLKDYTPDINKVFNEAFAVKKDGSKNIKSLAEQYEVLAKALEDTEKAYTRLTTIRVSVDDAIEATQVKHSVFGIEFNNPFDKNVVENIKKYAEAYDNADKSMMAFMRDYHDEIQRGLKEAGINILSTDLEGMEKAVKNLKFSVTDTDNAWWRFKRSLDVNPNALDAFTEYNESMKSLRTQWNETSNDIMTMGNRLFKNLATRWGSDVSAWSTEQRMAVYMVFDEIIGKEMEAAGVAEDVQKEIRARFMEPFGIAFRTETEAAYEEINELKKYLEGLTDKAWVIKMKVETSDSAEIVADQQKKLKEAKEKIKGTKSRLSTAGLVDKNGQLYLHRDLSVTEQQMVDDLKEYQDAEQKAKKVLDAYYADYESEKDKNKHKSKGRSEDSEAKRLREIAKLYKDAYDWYVKYEKQVGEGSALTKVQAQFQPLFDEFNKQWKTNLSLDSIAKYKENIMGLLDEAMKLYQQPSHKNNYMVDAIKVLRDAINNVDYEELGRKQEEYTSDMQRQLDELTRKWEIYNSVVSDTGNRTLAARLSGISPGATPADLKRANLSAFAGARIDYDRVLGMSEDEIEKYVHSLGVSEEKIKAIQNGLKDWKKAQEDVIKSDIENYAKWLGSLVDLESVRLRNQEEYNRVLEETNRLLAQGVITQEEADRRRNAAATNRDSKNWQSTTMYASLYNNSLAMAEGSFYEAYNREMANLFDQMKAGKITMSEYAEKVEKLNKIAAEFNMQGFLGIKGGVGAFLSGGYQGLIDYHWNKSKEKRANGDEEGAKEEEERAESMMKAQKAADQLLKAFQDLSTGADMLANLFDALGMEGAANAFGDAAGVLGGAASGASSLSAFGPWGMAAGAVLGGLTSIAQLHDNSIQREIDAIQDEVDALEENTRSIKSFRERTLGYDSGDLRRQYAAQYKSQLKTVDLKELFGNVTIDLNPAATAMYKYYSQGGVNGNGYQQELNNLKQQREDYIKMYDLEEEKKKSSNEALNEYKQKIAELDEQIAYFAEDLSNELFGIDLKGWADEIGDALMTAFENGEDAAEAFNDTVQDIMRQVLRKMLSIGIIEPMMERLRKRLFGENGRGGLFSATNPEGTIDAAMQEVASFFGEGGEGRQMIEAAETFYKRWQSVMGSQGLTLDSGETSSKASSSIKSITEQTADLIASYINAIRADVSVDRAMIAQYFPLYYAALTSSNASLRSIEQHTAAIMRSNDAIATSVSDLQTDIRGLKNKTWKMPVA